MSNNIVILKLDSGEVIENPEIDGLKISFFATDNRVIIYEGAVFHNSHFKLRKGCKVVVEKTHPRGLRNTTVDMAGSNDSSLYIEKGTSIESARFAMANDNNLVIKIGKNCMLSSNIVFRATDGHVIYSNDIKKEVLNKAKPIVIGNNVWIGASVVIMKGAKVADNTVIGTMSLVSRKFEQTNVVIAGNPAKIIKTDIDWDRTYIKNWSSN